MRVQKYCSEKGICSRREAEKLIKAGRVSVNGVVIKDLGHQIDSEKDTVTISGLEMESKRYFIINKEKDAPIESFVEKIGKPGLKMIFSLDKKSEGLALFTTDASLKKDIDSNKINIKRTFDVYFQESVPPQKIAFMSSILLEWDKESSIKKIKSDKATIEIVTDGTPPIKQIAEVARTTITKVTAKQIGSVHKNKVNSGEFIEVNLSDLK